METCLRDEVQTSRREGRNTILFFMSLFRTGKQALLPRFLPLFPGSGRETREAVAVLYPHIVIWKVSKRGRVRNGNVGIASAQKYDMHMRSYGLRSF